MSVIVETVPSELPSPQLAERAPRASVFLGAALEQVGSRHISHHRVRDLSAGGMRIDQAADLSAGDLVLVTLGMVQAVGATIMWVENGWAGIQFETEIDPDQARARAALTPKAVEAPRRFVPDTVPTAGWIGNLSSPYRR